MYISFRPILFRGKGNFRSVLEHGTKVLHENSWGGEKEGFDPTFGTAAGSFGSVSVLFVPSFPRFPLVDDRSWKKRRENARNLQPGGVPFPPLQASSSVGKQRRKLFHMRNCARTGLCRKFWTVPLSLPLSFFFLPPSLPQSSPIHFETRSLIRRVALILASSRASSNNLNCFLSVRFIFHRCIKSFPSLNRNEEGGRGKKLFFRILSIINPSRADRLPDRDENIAAKGE